MTANLSPTNTTGIIAIKQKVSGTDSLLSEALSVRVEPDQLKNATVYGTAVADLLNETLERYGEALGIGGNASTSAADSNNTTAAATTPSVNSSSNATVVNYADYQSTQGLVNMTKETLNQTKMLLGGSNATTATAGATNSSAKVDNDLDQLKTLIDNKTSYSQVATFVYNTVYPDLNSAIGLKLPHLDANQAIKDAMSGEE
jgi:hypothetical protein